MMYSGDKLCDIPDKQYLTVETAHAADIIRGLDLSGVSYFAKADDDVLYLTFSAKDKAAVDEIITKAESGEYEEMMLQLSESGADGYAPLYVEIADILHCAVGSVTSRPPEVVDTLAKTYINYSRNTWDTSFRNGYSCISASGIRNCDEPVRRWQSLLFAAHC